MPIACMEKYDGHSLLISMNFTIHQQSGDVGVNLEEQLIAEIEHDAYSYLEKVKKLNEYFFTIRRHAHFIDGLKSCNDDGHRHLSSLYSSKKKQLTSVPSSEHTAIYSILDPSPCIKYLVAGKGMESQQSLTTLNHPSIIHDDADDPDIISKCALSASNRMVNIKLEADIREDEHNISNTRGTLHEPEEIQTERRTDTNRPSNELSPKVEVKIENPSEEKVMINTQPLLTVQVQRENEDIFWEAKRHDDGLSLMTLMPCSAKSTVVCKLMNIRALEALTWNRVRSKLDGQRYRIESLWNTCVDFLLMGHIRQPTISSPLLLQAQASVERNAATVIDPHVSVCPFELRDGVCKIEDCCFQHIGSMPSNTFPQKPAAIIRNVETERPNDSFFLKNIVDLENEDQNGPNASKPSAAPETNPNVTHCLQELAQEKSLDFLRHLDPLYAVDPSTSPELVPLPNFNMPPQVGSPFSKEAKQNPKQPESNIGISKTLAATTPSSDSPPVAHGEVKTIMIDAEEILLRNEGLGQERSKKNQHPAALAFWWMDDHRLKKGWGRHFGLIQCLEHIGGICDGQKKILECLLPRMITYEGPQPANPLEGINFIGRVVDCTRLSIHAGRFDLAKAIVHLGVEMVRRMELLILRANISETSAPVLYEALEVLKRAIDVAFLYDSHQQNSLVAAFENETLLGILSLLVQRFYEHLADQNSTSCAQKHLSDFSGLLSQIRDAFNGNPQRLSSEDNPVARTSYSHLNLCLALLKPRPIFLATERRDICVNDFFEVRHLLTIFHLSRSVYINLAKSTDFAMHRNEVLEAFWKEAMQLVRGSDSQVLQAAIAVGSVLFGCIGNAVDSLQDKQNTNTLANLMAFDETLNHIVSCLRDEYLNHLFGHILAAPLVAASTSLAIFLRNYSTAQHRIEAAMAASSCINQMRVPVLTMSELLWSQLIIIQSSFPFDPKPKMPFTKGCIGPIPGPIFKSHQLLAKSCIDHGVQLNHVTLEGDWNLLPINPSQNLKHARNTIMSRLLDKSEQTTAERKALTEVRPFTNGFIDNCPLECRATFYRQSRCISGFPQSAFLVGEEVEMFELTRCALRHLPLSYGYHFCNLIILNLDHNALQELPESVVSLTKLQVLNVEKNEFRKLPDWIGKLTKLHTINVSSNLLTGLPSTLANLTELTTLRAENNPLTGISLRLLTGQTTGVLNISLNHATITVRPTVTPGSPELQNVKLEQPAQGEGETYKELMTRQGVHSAPSQTNTAAPSNASAVAKKSKNAKRRKKKEQKPQQKQQGVDSTKSLQNSVASLSNNNGSTHVKESKKAKRKREQQQLEQQQHVSQGENYYYEAMMRQGVEENSEALPCNHTTRAKQGQPATQIEAPQLDLSKRSQGEAYFYASMKKSKKKRKTSNSTSNV